MGVDSPHLVQLEATALPEPQRQEAWQRACAQLAGIFEPPAHEPTWIGPFSTADRTQIATLREAQAEAIVRGEAAAYAALCTSDVQLLLPGQPAACGLEEFVALESRLLSPGRFVRFEKTPLRVERSGDLAVETGMQQVQSAGSGGTPAPQKYVHVMRHTPEGWRYAVLTSNPCA
jgi:ketosteroid isomerase-like protein